MAARVTAAHRALAEGKGAIELVPERLHVVYDLTSMTYRRRIRLEVSVDDQDPYVPSAVAVYPTADWHEREVWDMFGVIFSGHPGLTRILMPDDWIGHPQRKDYPLGGIPVEYKGAEIATQDHGFAVDEATLPPEVEATHINLNDRTLEGLRHKTLPAFSVQYHPEASAGPHDSSYLFEEFRKLMG